jgi:putative endonuclease
MFYVYAIISLKDGRIYVGLTSDIYKRIKQHNTGSTVSTKPFSPWKLIYSEELPDRIFARKERNI